MSNTVPLSIMHNQQFTVKIIWVLGWLFFLRDRWEGQDGMKQKSVFGIKRDSPFTGNRKMVFTMLCNSKTLSLPT